MMKKTIVAMAAVAATGAFAQVTITGNIDIGVLSKNDQNTAKSSVGIAKNGISTSTLAFSGSEDLGGGLKAGFRLETTIAPEASSTLNSAAQTTPSADGQFYSGSPFSSEQFLSLSGSWGTVKVGEPNSAVFRTQGVSQPFGTGIGSGYGGTNSRLGYAGSYGISSFMGVANGGGTALRVIRNQKTAQYETPTMNGLSGMAEYSFANDNSTSLTGNSPMFMGAMVNYSSGPLNIGAAYNSYNSGSNGINGNPDGFAIKTIGLASGQNIAYQVLAANYTMGQHTFYTGLTNVRASNATEDSQSWNVAYKLALNANVDIIANMVSTSSALNAGGTAMTLANGVTQQTWNLNKKTVALGADYRLSKRTSLYVRYENLDSNTDNATTGETISTAFGVRHQF